MTPEELARTFDKKFDFFPWAILLMVFMAVLSTGIEDNMAIFTVLLVGIFVAVALRDWKNK